MKLLFSIPLIFLLSCKKIVLDPKIAEFCPQDGKTIGIEIDNNEKHCLDSSEATRIVENDKLQIFQIKYGTTRKEDVRLEIITNCFKGKGEYNIIVEGFSNGRNESYRNNGSTPNGIIKIIKCEESKDQNHYIIDGGFNFKIKFPNGKVSTVTSYFKSLNVDK
jgi:hypothetical protein